MKMIYFFYLTYPFHPPYPVFFILPILPRSDPTHPVFLFILSMLFSPCPSVPLCLSALKRGEEFFAEINLVSPYNSLFVNMNG